MPAWGQTFVVGLFLLFVLWIVVSILLETFIGRNKGIQGEGLQQMKREEQQAILALPAPRFSLEEEEEEKTPKVDVTLAARLLWETVRPARTRLLTSMTVTQDMEYVAGRIRRNYEPFPFGVEEQENEDTEEQEQEQEESVPHMVQSSVPSPIIPVTLTPVLLHRFARRSDVSLHQLALEDEDSYIVEMQKLFAVVEGLAKHFSGDINKRNFSLIAGETAEEDRWKRISAAEWKHLFRLEDPKGVYIESKVLDHDGNKYFMTKKWDWDTLETWIEDHWDYCQVKRG